MIGEAYRELSERPDRRTNYGKVKIKLINVIKVSEASPGF